MGQATQGVVSVRSTSYGSNSRPRITASAERLRWRSVAVGEETTQLPRLQSRQRSGFATNVLFVCRRDRRECLRRSDCSGRSPAVPTRLDDEEHPWPMGADLLARRLHDLATTAGAERCRPSACHVRRRWRWPAPS